MTQISLGIEILELNFLLYAKQMSSNKMGDCEISAFMLETHLSK